MKKVTIIIASILFVSFTQAQTQFGIKGGINLSTVTGDNSSNFSSAISAYAGGLANIAFDKKFALQPEVMISFEGTKFNGGSFNTTYLNLPVLGHMNAGSGFIIQSGPQFGLLLGAQQKYDKVGSTNVKDQLKSLNFSWVFGTGYQLPNSGMGFSLRYNLGFSNMNANTAITSHTSNWQVGVFYMFSKK